MNTNNTIKIQGLTLKSNDIEMIKSLIKCNPSWHRTKLSKEICELWNWKRADGNPKDMACRTMLLKLERQEYLKLPKLRRKGPQTTGRKPILPIPHSQIPIECPIKELYPITVREVSRSGHDEDLFNFLLFEHHYLSFRTTVGESMKYFIFDRNERPLGCVLFGSAAWKAIDRDNFIGWDAEVREKNLNYLTNNTRFLILPWVKVPHLASCILGSVLRRLGNDWNRRYGHEIYMVETFVEQNRFAWTCYKAATGRNIGITAGRSRQDRYKNMSVPVKDIYVYPLNKNYRRLLHDKAGINQLTK